ncbi:YjfI family protein [Oceanimonas sp. AH20CE76]|uniref:YjfI family protein n=1 Tax=Oceanimonas sp. AH20CE76 TaxID=2977120 RepID=UPI0031FE8B88
MELSVIGRHLEQLGEASTTGFTFQCYPIPGEVEVLRVTVDGREELPLFISVSDDQILCISYLWDESQVNPARRQAMLEAMLDMNIPMPLSAFARLNDWYVVFGALSLNSSLADIEHELAVLSDNCLEVIEDMAEFLL